MPKIIRTLSKDHVPLRYFVIFYCKYIARKIDEDIEDLIRELQRSSDKVQTALRIQRSRNPKLKHFILFYVHLPAPHAN